MESFTKFFDNPVTAIALGLFVFVLGWISLVKMTAGPWIALICLIAFWGLTSWSLVRSGLPDVKITIGLIILIGGACIALSHFLWPAKSEISFQDQTEAIGQLSKMGWTVKPKDTKSSNRNAILGFEISSRQPPDLAASKEFFQKISDQFYLTFQSVPNISGLDNLSSLEHLEGLAIQASDLQNVYELRNFKHLRWLRIGQVPLNSQNSVDVSALGNLVDLDEIAVSMCRVNTISWASRMTKLRKLSICQTPIRDLSPIDKLTHLEEINLQGSLVSDVSPLSLSRSLSYLTIDAKQVPSLGSLATLPVLKKIFLLDQVPLPDLGPIGKLTNLNIVYVNAQSLIDIGFVEHLPSLKELHINGMGFPLNINSQVTGVASLSKASNLETLDLSSVNIDSLAFLKGCPNIQNLGLFRLPLNSISDVSNLHKLKNVSLQSMTVDISPLLTLSHLQSVSLNQIPAALDAVSALRRRGVDVKIPELTF